MTLLVIRHAESVENADKYNGFYQDPARTAEPPRTPSPAPSSA
ncbi:hypothetical protein ACWC5I_15255 [Kitasatospora sp. NPDC001574]